MHCSISLKGQVALDFSGNVGNANMENIQALNEKNRFLKQYCEIFLNVFKENLIILICIYLLAYHKFYDSKWFDILFFFNNNNRKTFFPNEDLIKLTIRLQST